MSWTEFCSLLSGIMPDTPLGRIVSLRCETDAKVLKSFTKEQKRIRNQWLKRKAQNLKKDTDSYNEYWANFQKFAKDAFS